MQMVAGGITEALDEFCKALTPRVMSPLSLPGESELVWELPKLCLQLFNNSSMFFRSALLCGLLKHFTRFFPHVAQRFGDILNTPFRSEGLAEAYLRHSILPVIRLVHRFLSPPELARDTLLDPGFRSELGAWLVTMFRHLKLSVPFLEMFPRLEAAWNECFDELFGAWRESHIILALPKAETRDHIPSIRELLSNLKGSKRGEVSALLTLYETGPLSGPESIPRESAAGMLKEVEQHFRNLKEASESTRKQTLRQLERLFPVILGACFNGPMEEQTLNLFKAWVPEALSHVFLDGGSISRSSSEPLFALSLLDFVLQGAALIGEASPELCDTVGLRILQWAQREMAGSDCFGPILGSLLKVLITCFRSGEELQSKGEELLELITILLPRLRDPGPRPLGTQEIRVMLAASTVAWHFVAILIGYMEVESIASLLDSCAPAPVSLRAALGPRIVEPVVRQPRVNVRWSRLTGEVRATLGRSALEYLPIVASGHFCESTFDIVHVCNLVLLLRDVLCRPAGC